MATYKLTQQSGQFSGSSHSDFPAYVDLTEIGTLSQAEADSIRVYSDASLSTELAREIVSTEEMHVKIPSFSASDEIWVDYDGVRSDYATDATFGAENVWNSNYKAVYHMNDLTASTIKDSTSNGNDGAKKAVNEPVEATGKIGQGQDYDGTDDFISATHDTSLNLGAGAGTLIAWLKYPNENGRRTLHSKRVGGGDFTQYAMGQSSTDSAFGSAAGDGKRISVFLRQDGSNQRGWYTNSDVIDGDFHHIAALFNPTGPVMKTVVDGVDVAVTVDTNDGSWPNTNTTEPLRLGGDPYFMKGVADEARVLNTQLSVNWITTEYNNQNSPSTFWSVEEVVQTVEHTLDSAVFIQGTETHILDSLSYIEALTTHSVDTVIAAQAEYSRGDEDTLPTDTADLETIYNDTERNTVSTQDGSRVDITGQGFLIHQFQEATDETTSSINTTWVGQSTISSSTSEVFLQVYNTNTNSWENLSSDDNTAANTNITLQANITSSISDYQDDDNVVSFRIYQEN